MLLFELGNEFLGEARVDILLVGDFLNVFLLFQVWLLLLNLSFVDRKQVFTDVLSPLLDVLSTHIAPTLVPVLPVYFLQLAVLGDFKAFNEIFLVRWLETLFESRRISWKPLLNDALEIIVIPPLYASQILNLHFQFLDSGPQFRHWVLFLDKHINFVFERGQFLIKLWVLFQNFIIWMTLWVFDVRKCLFDDVLEVCLERANLHLRLFWLIVKYEIYSFE